MLNLHPCSQKIGYISAHSQSGLMTCPLFITLNLLNAKVDLRAVRVVLGIQRIKGAPHSNTISCRHRGETLLALPAFRIRSCGCRLLVLFLFPKSPTPSSSGLLPSSSSLLLLSRYFLKTSLSLGGNQTEIR